MEQTTAFLTVTALAAPASIPAANALTAWSDNPASLEDLENRLALAIERELVTAVLSQGGRLPGVRWRCEVICGTR